MVATLLPKESRIHRTVVIGLWVTLVVGVIPRLRDPRFSRLLVSLILAAGCVSAWAHRGEQVPAAFRNRDHHSGRRRPRRHHRRPQRRAHSRTSSHRGGSDDSCADGRLQGRTPGRDARFGLITLITCPRAEPVEALPAIALYLALRSSHWCDPASAREMDTTATQLASEETATQQLERLEQIHQALVRLSEDASAGRLNAVSVAASTLDDILSRFGVRRQAGRPQRFRACGPCRQGHSRR